MARTWRPKRVVRTVQATTAKMASMSSTWKGMPSTRPRPMYWKAGLRNGWSSPLVSTWAMPRPAMNSTRVAMIGWNPKRVMSTPLNSPTSQLLTRRSDDMLLKFTRQGKFLLQIGGPDKNKGNADTTSVNKPADAFVFAKTNEVFVADGYGNRRVIVFDADTGTFKRMWGGSGFAPQDAPAPAARGTGPAAAAATPA